MLTLLARMREAEAAADASARDEEILDSVKSLDDDTEEVSAFLTHLAEYDEDRAAAYLTQIKAHKNDLWDSLIVLAQEEEDMEEELPEEDELPMEEEEAVEEDDEPMEEASEDEDIEMDEEAEEDEFPMEEEAE